MSLPECMGGWCRRRDVCPAFGASHRERLVERACPPGQDMPEPVRVEWRSRWWQAQALPAPTNSQKALA